MSESKHTPGPWEIYGGIEICNAEGQEWKTIADIRYPSSANTKISVNEAEANASLIAAAPEMLEALQEAREVLSDHWFTSEDGEDYNNDDVIDMCSKLDAIIAKAKGES